jgi:tetratricopeptide (TPR) repeat protein
MRKVSYRFRIKALTLAMALTLSSAWAQSPVPFISQEGVAPGSLDFDDSNLNTLGKKKKVKRKDSAKATTKDGAVTVTPQGKLEDPGLVSPQDQTDEDKIFEKVYKNPDSLPLNLELAQIQLRNGNLKGAAATLGRILEFYPNEAIAQLLLAQTESNLGNYVEAKEYFRAVVNNPSAKPEQTANAQKSLDALIDSERLWRYGAQLQAGVGGAMNPLNSSRYITIFGYDVPTSSNLNYYDTTWIYFASATLERVMESQSNHSIVFSASSFNQQYRSSDAANLGVNTATIAYQVGDITDRIVVGFNSSATSLSGKGFINSNWGAASYQSSVGSSALVNIGVNYGYNNQLQGANYSGSSIRSNWMSGLVLGGKYFISSDWLAELNLSRYRYAAQVNYESYNMSYGLASLSYSTNYGVFGIFGSSITNSYSDVDPLSNAQRYIQTNSYGANYAISLETFSRPQKKDWTLNLTYQQGQANSNVQTYATKSAQYMALISKAF